MKWYVYILLCDQKTFYIGITRNLDKRLSDHTTKKSFFTKKFSEIKLVYKEIYDSKIKAQVREKQLKGWTKAKKKALVNGNMTLLIELSKST